MAFEVDPDLFRAGSYRNMAAHLCGPLLAGAGDRSIAMTAAGVVDVPVSTREPLVVITPAAPLDGRGLRVRAKLELPAPGGDLTPVEFGPYSEAGAFLPLHCPPAGAQTRTAAPFRLTLAAEWFSRDGLLLAIAIPDLSAVLEVRLIEGTLGKLIYVLGAEKARIRRQAREIAAFRNLSLAAGDALDRFGADLAVPRFSDEIRFDNAKREIITVTRVDGAGNPLAEPDNEYRSRLQIYYPFDIPNRGHVLTLLNGPGGDNAPNAGALGGLGQAARFLLDESTDPFAVAIHIVSTAGAQPLANFFKYLRDAYLILPADNAAANAIHDKRLLPSATRGAVAALRASLRAGFVFGPDMGIAPMLASTLDRLGRMRRALGINTTIEVTRAQDPSSSRYELGLGVDIKAIPAAELDQMQAGLTAPNRQPSQDSEAESLLADAAPLPSAQDPDGKWLLQAAGLQTVHRLAGGELYISHFPTFGLVVNQTTPAGAGGRVDLEARYQAPGDPGANAVLVSALAAALPQWTAAGGEPWTVLTDADAQARFSQNTAAPAAARNTFAAAGLPAVNGMPDAGPQLKVLPPELIETLKLGPQLTQRILAGQPQAAADLQKLAALLRGQDVASVLPLVTGPNEICVVVGAIGLPEAGINLAVRRATGFRWYTVPIAGAGGEIKSIGSRTVFVPQGAGLTAIVVVGYARRGHGDPYEVHVDLPGGALMNLPQYEFLMNALEEICPVGVLLNTFKLRQEHVDLDGDGSADPLPPSIFRTYRRFHRPRHRGEIAVPVSGS